MEESHFNVTAAPGVTLDKAPLQVARFTDGLTLQLQSTEKFVMILDVTNTTTKGSKIQAGYKAASKSIPIDGPPPSYQ